MGAIIRCPLLHFLAFGGQRCLALAATKIVMPTEATELHTAPFSGCQCCFGARRDHAGLKLGHRCHLLQDKLASCALDCRQIGKPHINASI
jgi:hypothetical protein